MTNSLRKLAKDLKAFAKRCKDFKYTEQALFVFLLCGIVGFADVTTAPTDKAIQNQRQEITTSIGDMRQQFKRVKSENDKLMKNYNLELIQLMEQGDHVVKSPWSSWQYGINTFYNDWRGTYKGKGNKIKDNGVYKRSQTLSRYLESPVIEKNANNTTTLGFVYEPNAEIPISASITPKSISKTNPNIQKNVAIASLPSFEPRVVVEPVAPTVNAPNPNIDIKLDITSKSRGSGETTRAFAKDGNAVMESIALKEGDISITRSDSSYSYTTSGGVNAVKIRNTTRPTYSGITGFTWGTTYDSTYTANVGNAFFQSNGSGDYVTTPSAHFVDPFGVTLNSSNIVYDVTSYTATDTYAELVHQDVHGGSTESDVNQAITDSGIGFAAADFSDVYKTNPFGGTTTTTKPTKYNVFANKGNITIKGHKAIFTHSYNHGGPNGIILNAGNIKLDSKSGDNSQHTVFLLSNDANNNGAAQHYYNTATGKVETNTTSTAMFLFVPGKKRSISVTNKGSLVLNGKNSVGIFANNLDNSNNPIGVNLHLNFSDATSAGNQTQITDHTHSSNNNNYVNTLSGGIVDKNSARGTGGVTQAAKLLTINSNKSAGLYMPHKNSFINGQFAVELTNNAASSNDGSAGIYSNSDVDLQGHYVKVGGTNNVGVYPVGNGSETIMYLGKGTVEVNGGSKNSGIVVKTNSNNTGRGRVYSESEMVMEGGTNNTAIYVGGHSGVNENDVTIKSLETDTTSQKDTVFIYSENAGKVKTDANAGGLSVIGEISSGDPEFDSTTGKVSKTVGAAYAKGQGTVIDISQATGNTFGTGTATPTRNYNIDIKGAQVKDSATSKMLDMYTGFGLFAEGGAKIQANNNKVKAEDTGAAIASKDTNSKVVLDGGEVYYKGSGFALFAKDGGEISLQQGKLTLDGKATGFSVDYSVSTSSQPINLTGTAVNIDSDDAILMSVKNATNLNTTGMGTNLLSKVNLTPASIGGSATRYKYAVLDGANINVDGDIDKADTTSTSDSYIFTRRIQLQNSNINVLSGKTVKAHLASADLTTINPDLTVPVGLDVSASENSGNTTTTGVNVANGATITVDRTDSGNGGVGAYVNYGKVTNDGKIEVEKLTPNDHAVGIYATNGTVVNNNTTGTVEVGGKDSIGILGLSYRIDSKNNVVYEKFNTGGAVSDGIGLVDITNKGKITLDGDNALGIYAKNNSLDATGVNAGYLRNSTSDTSATNDGEITLAGKNAIGMITEGGKITNDSNGKITINGQEGVAMYGTVAKDSATPTVNKVHSQLINKGTITLADTTATTPIIGMFTNDPDTSITTSGTINVGKKSYGVYGASNNVSMTGGAINVGDDGVGIFATGSSDTTTPTSTVTLSGGTITVGTNKAVGVFIADDANHPLKTTVTNTGTNVNVGNDSFGYVVDSTTGTDLILGSATNKLTSSLDTDSVYVYSNDKNGFVYSNTDITTNGGKIYGLYTAGRSENYGNMDLRGGTGNVGIYSTGTSSTGAGATNYGTITVGGTNLTAKEYGIGMATGYYNETTGAISNEGLIENRGTLNVVGDNSIGMYAVGSGSKAINAAGATIDISGKNATGMYIDHGAEGINYGTIKSTGSATGIKGVATVNGGYIKNYGTIAITSPDGIGIYQDAASSLANKNVPGNVSGTKKAVYTATSTDEKYIVSPKGSLLIQNPPRTPRLVVNGKEVELRGLDTNVASPTPSYVTAGITTLDLSLPEFAEFKNSPSNAQASELGMYIDTSGVNYTNPIQGLNNLIGLDAINLIIGTEAAKYTDAKAIEIGDNILTPYNNAISSLTTTGTKLNINAAGLTWLAQPVQGATKPIETLYMVKIPYTYFTSPKDENTYNFLDGLEQRYGVDGYGARGAREKLLFNKLNGIGKGETHIFTQAVDEMKGHQYANTQQRINETGSLLDDEFKYLHDEWRNPSKQNNKIKIFGIRNEYNTDTAGIIDYTSNAYGVAYVHEDETVKLGNSSGWYAGAVNNRFRFKDNGKSKENQTMLKAGIFKTMSPYMDHNGSLRWTVAGDVFVGQNEMKRRFLVVDDIFSAKGDYTSYGAAFKTDLGYDIRMSERTHLRPYGALKMEYGRFNNIKEDDGEMRLEVKGNDYFSVKPEVGVQFKYVQPLAVRTQLSVGLTAAYENELGKLQERRNQARVGYTDAGWYNLEQEKENRRGNGKFDFNLGVDNTRFGVTVNAGYDTKGSNIRGGIGFRAIY